MENVQSIYFSTYIPNTRVIKYSFIDACNFKVNKTFKFNIVILLVVAITMTTSVIYHLTKLYFTKQKCLLRFASL